MFQPWNDSWISTKVILVWLQFHLLFYGVGEWVLGHYESQVTMTRADAEHIGQETPRTCGKGPSTGQ